MTEDRTEGSSRFSRRQVLAAGGAGIVLGVAATEVGNLVASSSPASTPAAPPDVDLMEEHGVLKRVLLIYGEASRRISAGQPAPVAEIHESAVVVHDFIEGFHEALEEGYVFPQLTRAGLLVPTVDTLYVQHARGRTITQFLLAQKPGTADPERMAAAMDAFVQMYQPHEAREDTVVFPAFRSIHDPDQLDDLGNTFASLQEEQFGHRGFDSFVQQVAQIEMRLGIYDLAQFTAEPMSPTS